MDRIKSKLPFLAILVAFVWASYSIATRRQELFSPDIVVIRLGHWQLEPGFRDGINQGAADYRKLHPNVRIVQEAVPESIWKQWVTTQLMGGTAPDIVQAGGIESNLMTTFYVRYYLPLTSWIGQPNPYDKGTPLEKLPYINTFQDGLRAAYIQEVKEFMNIPLSLASVRIFYNKELFQKLTGLNEPPSEYREFLKACEKISEQRIGEGPAKGGYYIPIAGSGWHFSLWNNMMFGPVTSSMMTEFDMNRDGRLSKDEMFLGFKTGRLSMAHPAIQGMLKMVAETTAYFQPGYTGLTRDEALFLFAQQRAVFITAGSYDSGGLREQAAGKFDVGVINFPYPSSKDPEYAGIIEGPRYESLDGQAQFAITRTSKHPEIALDFLRFMTSRDENQKVNETFGWIPIIRGTESSGLLKAFAPNLTGVASGFDPNLGGETNIKWSQLYSLYQVSQISAGKLSREFEEFYLNQGGEDFLEFSRNQRRTYLRDIQRMLAARFKALRSNPKDQALEWVRYRQSLFWSVMGAESGRLRNLAIYKGNPDAYVNYPYRYFPSALLNARGQAQSGTGTEPFSKAKP